MKRKSPKTYKSRRLLKIILTVFLSLLLAFIIIAVSLFFGLRQYIVYDNDGGLHLDIPWLQDSPPDQSSAMSPIEPVVTFRF